MYVYTGRNTLLHITSHHISHNYLIPIPRATMVLELACVPNLWSTSSYRTAYRTAYRTQRHRHHHYAPPAMPTSTHHGISGGEKLTSRTYCAEVLIGCETQSTQLAEEVEMPYLLVPDVNLSVSGNCDYSPRPGKAGEDTYLEK